MPRFTLVGLGVLLSGCGLLPSQEVPCAQSAACSVQTAFVLQIPGSGPVGITRAGLQFIVSDSQNNRVLIWPQLPTSAAALPTVVLGQVDLSSSPVRPTSASTLRSPQGVSSDGTVLAVADSGNNRVLIWDAIPSQNNQRASAIIGQQNETSNAANSVSLPMGLKNPSGVLVSNQRLYVADTGNHRVLIWNSIPTANKQADRVLGQANFNSNAVNRNQTTPPRDGQCLSSPSGIYADENSLYVNDRGNMRILIWNTSIPSTDDQVANIVLGAPQLDAAGTYSAKSLQTYQGRLYASFSMSLTGPSNQVAIWNSVPMADIPNDNMIGPNVLSGVPDDQGGNSLSSPDGILVTDVGTYIADTQNGRIVVVPPSF